MSSTPHQNIEHLHPLEIRALLALGERPLAAATLIADAGLNLGQCNQVFSWWQDKQLITESERVHHVEYELTELGERYRTDGLPEERIVALLQQDGPHTLPELAAALALEQRDVGSAYGGLAREGAVRMDADKRVDVAGAAPARVDAVRALLDRLGDGARVDAGELTADQQALLESLSRKRGASKGVFRVVERDEVSYQLTDAGRELHAAVTSAGLTGEETGQLTAEMLADGSWRQRRFRRYNVNTPASRVLLGRRNPYAAYLEAVKDKLTALGFEEFDGPLVETNFWCCDALFMPQFHAARDEHDVYFIKPPADMTRELEQPYFDRVAATHQDGWQTGSRGWGYRFDRDFTRRTILRSQGTVLSARALTRAKVPGKYFGVVRCFRPDDVDATHLSDFYQTEGIVLGEQVNLKTLLGLLKMFAEEVAGATEVRYVPAYFPFTEPSVEVMIKHPTVGWTELGGSGIFRPEVTKPLGIDVPVLAWGLGIDRMAMMSLGIDDIRELFSLDLDQIRTRVAH